MSGQERFYRRRIQLALEDAREARPSCSLDHKTRVDNEGRVWLDMMCHSHGASWSEVIADPEGEPCSPDTSDALAHRLARVKAPKAPVWEDTEAPNPNVPKKGV